MRTKLPSLKTARNKADALLTPIIKLQYPNCLLCGQPTQVAHHFQHRSKSTILRYDLNNLIPLCNSCHYKLHQNESYWAAIIVQMRGIDWFNDLRKRGQEIIKADVHFFIAQAERLKEILDELKKS